MYKIFINPLKMDIPKIEKVFWGIYFFSITVLIFEIIFTLITGSRFLFIPDADIREFFYTYFLYTSIMVLFLIGTIVYTNLVIECKKKGILNFSYLQFLKNKSWQNTSTSPFHLKIASGLTCGSLFLLVFFYIARGFDLIFYFTLDLMPNLKTIKYNLNLFFLTFALSASFISHSRFNDWIEKKKSSLIYLCLALTLFLCFLTFYY
jgi:hypothetical protein